MKRIEELLIIKEARALWVTAWIRIVFVSFMMVIVIPLAASTFEIVVSISHGLFINFVMVCTLYNVKKMQYLRVCGIAGVLVDLSFILIMPWVWYFSVGGFAVSEVYLIKAYIWTVGIPLLVLSTFALKALYPLLVLLGYLINQAVLGFFVYNVDPNLYTDNYVEAVLGAKAHLGQIFAQGISMIFIGGGMAFLSYYVKKTITETVHLEKSNLQLGRYFSPNVAQKIMNTSSEFTQHGGQKQTIAILFSDLRGFTTISERLKPEQVFELLGLYHTKMVEIIFKHKGTLDKFIGDGIMATFGTPETSDQDAQNALNAGIEMNAILPELNREIEHKYGISVSQGIGIHYGEAIVGNIGSNARLEYTVIGDSVNTASRIESACKTLNKTLLVSETLKNATSGNVKFEASEPIALKGKSKKLRLYSAQG